jgi:hypothetical protein
MQIKLISENKLTEEQEEQVFTLPVAIGRDITQLPADFPDINGFVLVQIPVLIIFGGGQDML